MYSWPDLPALLPYSFLGRHSLALYSAVPGALLSNLYSLASLTRSSTVRKRSSWLLNIPHRMDR